MSREIQFQHAGGKILIDGEAFDWDLDGSAVTEANRHSGNPEFMRAIHNDIMGHFLSSLSEVLGFAVTMGKVNDSLKRGFISK